MRYHPITLFSRPFLTDPDDSLDLTKWGTYEPYEMSLIRGVLDKDSFALDIGAHIGYVTRGMLDTGARVMSFEPNPFNFVFLEHNTVGFPKSQIHRLALSDYYGVTELALSPVNSGDDTLYQFDDYDRVKVKVNCAPYDTLDVWGTPSFVKLDIQGGELRALKGMSKLLSKNTPLTMAIEYYPDALRAAGDNPVEMLTLLWEQGFKIWEIREGSDGRLDEIGDVGWCEREDLRKGYVNLWAVRE